MIFILFGMNVLKIGATICIFCTTIVSLQSGNFHFKYDTRLVFNSTDWDEFRDISDISCAFKCFIREICCDAQYDHSLRICLIGVSQKCCHKTETSVGSMLIERTEDKPKDCSELPKGSCSGNYTIYPTNSNGIDVYCDMDTDGGHWTVIQRRLDGSIDFYRNWMEYKQGFGDVNGEYWIGNAILHTMSMQNKYELRVDLADWEGNTSYAVYDLFEVGDEVSNYLLTVGKYTGNAGNAFGYHNYSTFSTMDKETDINLTHHCAVEFHGGWWYRKCADANLNGKYQPGIMNKQSVFWDRWIGPDYSLKTVYIMIRPLNLLN